MPFYAVKRGRVPGVYESWAECQNQTDGFVGAKFKKFAVEEDAYTFAEVPMEKNSKDSVNGEVTKVFEKLISKFEDKVAELSSLTESLVSALPKLGDSDINLAFSEIVNHIESDVTKLKATTDLAVRSKFLETAGKRKSDSGTDASTEKKKKAVLEPRFTGDSFDDDDGVTVYTDGSCFHNGKHGASAGIGVYWGPDSSENVSERLPGRQTNNRAEIHAVIKAVEQALKKNVKNLIINTDSMFLINCVTKWMAGWKKKGWVKSDGEEVTNKEELQDLDALMDDINIKWVHVDAHCGISGNEAADKLANQGARRPLPE